MAWVYSAVLSCTCFMVKSIFAFHQLTSSSKYFFMGVSTSMGIFAVCRVGICALYAVCFSMILFIDLMRRGFAACISAIFVVGIIGVNDIVGIVRAVGADGSPVIDGNDGRPVIVGKIGTAVKKEYAVFIIVDAVVLLP